MLYIIYKQGKIIYVSVRFEIFKAVKIWIVVLQIMILCSLVGGTIVSEELIASSFYPEPGGNRFLQNAGYHQQDHTAS
jgi:hypothetical protein